MITFRKELNTYTWDEVKDKDNSYEFSDSDSFVLEDEIKSILDSIENDVNMIKNKLKEIKGLSEIDEIYDIAKELASRLY